MYSTLHGVQVIGLFEASKYLKEEGSRKWWTRSSPFSKLTLCPKVTAVCSKIAQKFPRGEEKKSKIGECPPTLVDVPGSMLMEVFQSLLEHFLWRCTVCLCSHLAPTASNHHCF